MDTGAGGWIEVGLLPVDHEGPAQVPTTSEYPTEACDRIVCNSIQRAVTWKGSADVSSLAGKPVRMHVRMRNAKLYAFQFVGDEPAGGKAIP